MKDTMLSDGLPVACDSVNTGMPSRAQDLHTHQRLYATVFGLWCIGVVYGLLSQGLLAMLRTPWGLRTVPAVLVEVGMVPRAYEDLLVQLVDPPGVPAVARVASALASVERPEEPVVVTVPDSRLAIAAADLRYTLYPRPVVERFGAQDAAFRSSAHGCLVALAFDGSIELRCGKVVLLCPSDGGPCR